MELLILLSALLERSEPLLEAAPTMILLAFLALKATHVIIRALKRLPPSVRQATSAAQEPVQLRQLEFAVITTLLPKSVTSCMLVA